MTNLPALALIVVGLVTALVSVGVLWSPFGALLLGGLVVAGIGALLVDLDEL